MKIEVDTNSRLDKSGDTVFSFSNDIQKVILLKQTVRNECLERLTGKKLKKELRLFAACIYLLIKDCLEEIEEIIDKEYPGHEEEIRWILLNMLKSDLSHSEQRTTIRFEKIGKKSSAHEVAWKTLRKERNPDRVVTSQEIFSALLK